MNVRGECVLPLVSVSSSINCESMWMAMKKRREGEKMREKKNFTALLTLPDPGYPQSCSEFRHC